MTTPRIETTLGAAILLMTPLVGAPPASDLAAQEPDAVERGRNIAEEVDRRDRGFGDYQVSIQMILRDRRGEETVRELEHSVLELEGGEERSIVYFESPRDIRGTALLTFSYPDRDNEQWLYLPALRRTRRISPSGRSSPFMGSEFAYEDLMRIDVDRYDHRYLREDEMDGRPVHVVERVPRYDGTGYARQQMWVDAAEFRILRIDFRDLRDRELKTLTLAGYSEFLDGIWKPGEGLMINHRTGESTVLRWEDYRFRTGLEEADFTRGSLGRLN